MKVISEGPIRITRPTIDAVWRRRQPGQRLVIRDAECRGLALLVNPTSMAWTYAYRPRGEDPATGKRWPNRSVTIGNPASHGPEAARLAVNAVKGQAAAGGDPVADKKATRRAADDRRGRTIERALEAYRKALPARSSLRGGGAITARHAADELAHAAAAVATMEATAKTVDSLTASDLKRLLAAEAGRAATARARFGAVSRFFDWCMETGYATINPCLLVSRGARPRAPEARSRFHKPEQLAALWKGAEGLQSVWRDLARFLIATPCRRSEAARMDWQHVDLKAAIWSQAGKMTKNRQPHRFHLHGLALSILRDRHIAAGCPAAGLVFPAPMSRKAIDTFSDIKAALATAADFADWSWHDFRRAFATELGERGVAEPVVDAMLNHRQTATRGGVLGVYQRATRWPEQVRAMDLWGDALDAAISGRPEEDNVFMIGRVAARRL
jgi:integrase